MSKSTILRVKRRLEDNPQDALVLVCKRQKTEDNSDISPSLFVFRGSVEKQDNISVKKLPKPETRLKENHTVEDIIKKIRQERQNASVESRYQIVNCLRGLQEADNVCLVDLEAKTTNECEGDYTYDLYTSMKPDFDVSMLDNLVSIENYETDLIIGSYRDNGKTSPTSSDNESDDSNDENNWRNDYPDSEHSSIDEEDMIRAVQQCNINDDLSSDEGEECIYDGPPDEVFKEDVKRYGAAYAKYKAKVLAEQNSTSLIHSHPISKAKESYKDDSDDDGFYYGEEEDSEHFKDQYRIEELSD